MKRILIIAVTIWVAVVLAWTPAVSGNGAAISISVSPATVDFGNILPGRDATGVNMIITNDGDFTSTVTAEITDDATGFYTTGLYLDGVPLASWQVDIAGGADVTVSPQLIDVPPDISPGSYSCTVIFWAEETP